MLEIACPSKLDTVMDILATAKEQITPMPSKKSVGESLKAGCGYLQEESVLLWSILKNSSYYGELMGTGAVQVQYLVSRHKGSGAGGRLLSEFLKATPRTVFLLVREDNEAGIRFYRRHGLVSVRAVQFKTFTSILMVRPAKG